MHANGSKITGFEPLGFSESESRKIAQDILNAAKGHVLSPPDDASTVNKWVAFNDNFISVGRQALKDAGLSEDHIVIMNDVRNHSLDHKFYDGPEIGRFVFLRDGLEKVAGMSRDAAGKYTHRNGHNGHSNGRS